MFLRPAYITLLCDYESKYCYQIKFNIYLTVNNRVFQYIIKTKLIWKQCRMKGLNKTKKVIKLIHRVLHLSTSINIRIWLLKIVSFDLQRRIFSTAFNPLTYLFFPSQKTFPY